MTRFIRPEWLVAGLLIALVLAAMWQLLARQTPVSVPFVPATFVVPAAGTPVVLHAETQADGFAILCDDNPAPLRTCIDAHPATAESVP